MPADANSFRSRLTPLRPETATTAAEGRSGNMGRDGYAVLSAGRQGKTPDDLPTSIYGGASPVHDRPALAPRVWDGPNLDTWKD